MPPALLPKEWAVTRLYNTGHCTEFVQRSGTAVNRLVCSTNYSNRHHYIFRFVFRCTLVSGAATCKELCSSCELNLIVYGCMQCRCVYITRINCLLYFESKRPTHHNPVKSLGRGPPTHPPQSSEIHRAGPTHPLQSNKIPRAGTAHPPQSFRLLL